MNALNGRMAVIDPAGWYATLAAPALAAEIGEEFRVVLRSYRDTDPLMEKPALNENIVCLHQGGPKRIHRWQAGRHESWEVARDSVSAMPMFCANRWLTEGPVAFTHLTLSSGLLARFALEEFDRAPGHVALADQVGAADPAIAGLMLALIEELQTPLAGRLYQESLVSAIVLRALARYAPSLDRERAAQAKGGLAGWQLRRVIDHMAARIDQDIGLADMVRLTGLSRSHFFRAFRKSTGVTPIRYLLALRMERARQILATSPDPIGEVARRVGFSGPEPFTRAFQRSTGLTPTVWRRQHVWRFQDCAAPHPESPADGDGARVPGA